MSQFMSTSNSGPAFAFFGATGGCTSTCLVHTLQAGHKASALVRSPTKLQTQLVSQGIPESTIAANLHVIEGSILDVTAVKETLLAGRADDTPTPIIISGVGGTPQFQWSIDEPFTLDNPNICQETSNVLVQALKELNVNDAHKPLLAFISTTGVSQPRGPEDVPFLFRFLYHYMLKVPHADKRVAEDILRAQGEGDGVFRHVLAVRPSLLVGTTDVHDARGLDCVRVGTERKPAVGYTIKRADVGEWLYREVVEKGGVAWRGEMVTLTY